LWDVNVSDWPNDTLSARFGPDEGYELDYMRFVRQVTGKPTVGVGRFTSPDLMSRLVRDGVLDFIGAARPSIADPYLPSKIRDGRIEDIRECIGCNICASSDVLGVPIRCTQNPTMGEEWRRGWNPELITPKASDSHTLVVGSGPAGLECALQLARRGYDVTLAEAQDEFGGRAVRESRLTGLGTWRRVADNRIFELERMANVEMFKSSALNAEQVLELGADKVFLATGSTWRRDGTGRTHLAPLKLADGIAILTPDDIMNCAAPTGETVIYDDDQGYLGGVIADHLVTTGSSVTFVSTASVVSPFTSHTLEQARVQSALIEKNVTLHLSTNIRGAKDAVLMIGSTYGGPAHEMRCDTLVLVTARQATRSLYNDMVRTGGAPRPNLLGDALAPGLIADATFGGHLAARSFEANEQSIEDDIFRREMPSLTYNE
jgi:dimethylamine/trimethylamine dehydrogenase